MDFNNNNENFNDSRESFFQNVETDNLKTSNISGSGISYGNEKNDNTKMILMVFFILFAVVVLIIMAMKLSNRKPKNNIAEIPVIESYKDIRTEHEMPKPNELYDTNVYKKDKEEIKDFGKKTEMETMELGTTQTATSTTATVREIEAVKTVPAQKIISKPVKKNAVIEKKKTVQKPKVKILKPTSTKPRLIEKKTEVEGEVEMVMEQPTAKIATATTSTNGSWYVQLVSTLSEVSANSAWVKLKSQHPQIFTGVKHKVFKISMNGKTYYRLRAIGFDVNSATTFCNNLKAVNLTCFVGK